VPVRAHADRPAAVVLGAAEDLQPVDLAVGGEQLDGDQLVAAVGGAGAAGDVRVPRDVAGEVEDRFVQVAGAGVGL
jgi:hypothetical protein